MKKIFLMLPCLIICYNAFAQYDYYTSIKTPTNVTIEAIYRVEFSADYLVLVEAEAADWINTYGSNAQRVAPASRTYNCHNFAWHNSDGGNRVWINQFDKYDGANLSKYWSGTSPTYQLTTSTKGTKAFYPLPDEQNGDHSAKVISSTLFESKWGAWPRYQHAPSDCPYNATGLQYYCVPVEGDGVICTSKDYSAINIPGATYNWSSNNVAISGSGVSVTATKSSDGPGWIKVQISSPYSGTVVNSYKKDVWVGKPDNDLIDMGVMFSDFPYDELCINDEQAIAAGHSAASQQRITKLNWNFGAWSSYFTGYDYAPSSIQNSRPAFMLDSYAPSSQIIQVWAENDCGTDFISAYGKMFYAIDCYGGGWYMTYTNPVDDLLTITFEPGGGQAEKSMSARQTIEMLNKEVSEFEIQIWHEVKGLVKKQKCKDLQTQVDVSGLSPGRYYLHVIIDKEIIMKQLIVE